MKNRMTPFLVCAFLAMAVTPAAAQTGRGVQTFVPSESQLKLEEAMKVLREARSFEAAAPQAESLMREAIAADVKQTRAYYNLAVLLVKSGRTGDAMALLDEALTNNPEFGDGLALRAQLNEGAGTGGESEALFQQALEKDPMSAVANNHMAKNALARNDWQNAILHSRKALVGNPESVNAYLNMGMAYYNLGQYDLAILVTQSGLRHDYTNAALLNLEGLILLRKDDVKEALARFNRALAASPDHLEAQMNAGALTLNYNDFESAFKHFDAAAQIAPKHREALLSRGVALRGLERYDEALSSFQAILAQFPDENRAQYNICILYQEHMSKFDEALVECDKFAKSIESSHPKFEEMERRIKGIQSTIEALKQQYEEK